MALLGIWLLAWPDPTAPLAEGPAALEVMMETHTPEVVLLGNSLVRRGLDTKQLSTALGLSEGAVQSVYVSHSRMISWYATLKHRILSEHPPAVVVVGTTPLWTLDTTMKPAGRARMAEMVNGHDPLVARALGEPESALVGRVTARRVQLREALLGGIRRATITTLGGDDAEMRPRLDELFALHNTDRLPDRVIPIAQSVDDNELSASVTDALSVEEALIDEIAAVCAEAGVSVVFAWMPLREDRAPSHTLPDDLARQTILAMRAAGAGFVELTEPLDDRHFHDPLHLNQLGRQVVTGRLAASLKEIDALGAMVPARLPARLLPSPAVTLEGAVSPDDPRVSDWPEEARWIPPGGTLTVQLPESWPLTSGALTVSASVHGEEPGVPVLISGERVGLLAGDAGMRRAALTDVQRTIRLSVPDDGPLTLVHHLVLDGEDIIRLSAPASLLGARTSVTVDGAEIPVNRVQPEWRKGMATAALGALDVVENDAVYWATGERLCSPIRLLEDGTMLGAPQSCRSVKREQVDGALCVRGEQAWWRSSDGRAQHDYALTLDPERRCGAHRWLYPDDVLVMKAKRAAGGSVLQLQASALSEGPWVVSVRHRSRRLLRQRLTARDLQNGVINLPLSEPVPPGARRLVVEIRSRGYLTLSEVLLGDLPLAVEDSRTTAAASGGAVVDQD